MGRRWFSYKDVSKTATIVRISKSTTLVRDDAWEIAQRLFTQDYCKKQSRNLDDAADMPSTRNCWIFKIFHSAL